MKLWNLGTKKCVRSIQAHEGLVRGLCFLADGDHFLTVGDDKCIKMWETEPESEENVEPTDTSFSKVVFLVYTVFSEFSRNFFLHLHLIYFFRH